MTSLWTARPTESVQDWDMANRRCDVLWHAGSEEEEVPMLVVLPFNRFGDWVRDALDPKLRQL
jgi:hypothetical protein